MTASSTSADLLPPGYLTLALQTLTDHGLPSDDPSRLSHLISCAVKAQALLFAAMLHEPAQPELDSFVEDFLLRSITNPEHLEAR
jgi:hypothetical protein